MDTLIPSGNPETLTLDDILKRIPAAYIDAAREIRQQYFLSIEAHNILSAGTLLNPVKLHVLESGDHLIARAEVPGFTPHEIKVCIEPRSLSISGKTETDQDDQGTGETVLDSPGHSLRRTEQILRVIELPVDVDPANAKATVKDSTLEVVMPKAPPAKSVRVQAKVA